MARCPQNKGKGKGSSHSAPSSFTGLTLPEPSPDEQWSGEAEAVQAPWDDLAFEAPREAFSVFMIGQTSTYSADVDPSRTLDPWIRSSSP